MRWFNNWEHKQLHFKLISRGKNLLDWLNWLLNRFEFIYVLEMDVIVELAGDAGHIWPSQSTNIVRVHWEDKVNEHPTSLQVPGLKSYKLPTA